MTAKPVHLGMDADDQPFLCLDPAGIAASAPEHDPRGSAVALIDGRLVSSWSEAWKQECCLRELTARTCLGLEDKAARHRYLADHAAEQALVAQLYALPCEPEAYGAESRRRVEAVVLERWQRRRAELAAP